MAKGWRKGGGEGGVLGWGRRGEVEEGGSISHFAQVGGVIGAPGVFPGP